MGKTLTLVSGFPAINWTNILHRKWGVPVSPQSSNPSENRQVSLGHGICHGHAPRRRYLRRFGQKKRLISAAHSEYCCKERKIDYLSNAITARWGQHKVRIWQGCVGRGTETSSPGPAPISVTLCCSSLGAIWVFCYGTRSVPATLELEIDKRRRVAARYQENHRQDAGEDQRSGGLPGPVKLQAATTGGLDQVVYG